MTVILTDVVIATDNSIPVRVLICNCERLFEKIVMVRKGVPPEQTIIYFQYSCNKMIMYETSMLSTVKSVALFKLKNPAALIWGKFAAACFAKVKTCDSRRGFRRALNMVIVQYSLNALLDRCSTSDWMLVATFARSMAKN